MKDIESKMEGRGRTRKRVTVLIRKFYAVVEKKLRKQEVRSSLMGESGINGNYRW